MCRYNHCTFIPTVNQISFDTIDSELPVFDQLQCANTEEEGLGDLVIAVMSMCLAG